MNSSTVSDMLLVVAFVLTARELAQSAARQRADAELAELRADVETAVAGDLSPGRRAQLTALLALIEDEQEELTSSTLIQALAIAMLKGITLREIATAARESRGTDDAGMCPEHARLRMIAGRYLVNTLPIVRALLTTLQGVLTTLFFGAFAGSVFLDLCARLGDVAIKWMAQGPPERRQRSAA